MLRNAEANGESLCSVEKGYSLGTGVSFRMFFRKKPCPHSYTVVALYGRLRDEADPIFNGQNIYSILSMKLLWFTVGYYYFLSKV